MIKTETSMKVTRNFQHSYSCGYCDLQYILPRTIFTPMYYNTGIYGWNNDMYVDYEDDTIVSTGYRNMRGERIPNDILDYYSKRASNIRKHEKLMTYDEMKEALYKNFKDMIKFLIDKELYPDLKLEPMD